jgi:hypothetical protein
VRRDELTAGVAHERRPRVLGDQPPYDGRIGFGVKTVVAHDLMLAVLGGEFRLTRGV